MSKRSSGFTLVELLVVIAIMGLLMSMLLPAINSVRAAARRLQCSNNVKQISLATLTFETNFKKFPRGLECLIDEHDWVRHSWYPYLLPYMEQEYLYKKYMAHYAREDRPGGYDYTFLPDKTAIVSAFLCPDDPNAGKMQNGSSDENQQGFHGNYMGNGGNTFFNYGGPQESTKMNGIYPCKRMIKLADIKDGASNTLMYSEILVVEDGSVGSGQEDIRGRYLNSRHAGALFSTLYPPNTKQPDRHNYCISTEFAPCTSTGSDVIVSARSNHSNGVTASNCSASVTYITNQIDMAVWQAMGSRAGYEAEVLEF